MRTLVSLAVLVSLGCSATPGGGARPDASDVAGADGGASTPGADAAPWPGADAGSPSPGTDAGPAIDAGCDLTTPVATTIVGDPPDMLLTVDISGSMCSPLVDSLPPSMISKLSIMRDALDGLVGAYEARINFGLMLFPSDDMCAPGTVENEIAPRNAAPIRGTLAGLSVGIFDCPLAHPGATPTHTTLDAAGSYLASVPENPIGRYVLLATDGLPNCGPELPDGGTEETVDETVAAIEALRAAGIQTYVLGFGADLSGGTDALNRMAAAGGTGTPYSARSATELERALDTIAAEVVPPSCTVELDGPERDPRLFQVRFDGGPLIPRDESRARGWDYDPSTNTITFYGPECDRVRSGDVGSIDVDFGCPGPLI
jgi:hypothetical protein